MSDLTIIFITANLMPPIWTEYQARVLTESGNGFPIITISRKPTSIGLNLIDDHEKSYWNIYRQMLRGAQIATTPYIAMAEDDTLYTREHFTEYRPALDAVSYNRSRWSLFSWEERPIFCLRQRISNCSLIASREYLVESLSERMEKYPDRGPEKWAGEVGRKNIEKALGVTVRKCEEWYGSNPIVQLNHLWGTDERQQTAWKKHGQIKAIEIPYWGKARDIVDVYKSV